LAELALPSAGFLAHLAKGNVSFWHPSSAFLTFYVQRTGQKNQIILLDYESMTLGFGTYNPFGPVLMRI
jgi:hypothetical protein